MADLPSLPPPVPPTEPEPWECCGNGCEPCVYDRYWQALERYDTALERWRQDVAAVDDKGDAGAGSAIDKGGVNP